MFVAKYSEQSTQQLQKSAVLVCLAPALAAAD